MLALQLQYMREWLGGKLNLDESGQAASEYVLTILGVVLFMVFAAFALQDVLNGAVTKISSWVASVNGPGTP